MQNAFRAGFAARFCRAHFDFHILFNKTVENFRTRRVEQTPFDFDSATELLPAEQTVIFGAPRFGHSFEPRGFHTMKLRQRAEVRDRDMIYLRPASYRPQ
ncbi:MAG TPA: hypothetical protein VLW83_12585 [Candidatus Acidoferrales bacterium]|nr:hypothetical protein [Candidatus Acidoferrales bacterium]